MRTPKYIFSLLYLPFTLLLLSCQSIHKTDAVKVAKEASMSNTLIDTEISYFLIESLDSHLLSLEEGMLAAEKGTTEEIRKHGKTVMQDQTLFLNEIITIANCRKVKLPNDLSNKNARKLKGLREKIGSDFDKAFIKQMAKEYNTSLDEFERASVLKDRYVRAYGRHYLPLIQTRLGSIHNVQQIQKDVVIANN